ncbi:hypothetical protein [Sphingobium fontiphilum]|nr:hypothetical protein [Sphingobium fontiphilum]
MAQMTGGIMVAAMLAGSITPAQARPRHYDRHHHRHDDFGLGDAIGIAALLGAVAIVASSASKDRRAAHDDALDGQPPPSDDRPDGVDALPHDDGAAPTAGDALEEAANACALAARDEASANGGYAEVRSMDEPQPIDGGFNIDGKVESRASWNAASGALRRFTCTVRDGRVAQVYLSRDVVAR